jgi:hypothetical protein
LVLLVDEGVQRRRELDRVEEVLTMEPAFKASAKNLD